MPWSRISAMVLGKLFLLLMAATPSMAMICNPSGVYSTGRENSELWGGTISIWIVETLEGYWVFRRFWETGDIGYIPRFDKMSNQVTIDAETCGISMSLSKNEGATVRYQLSTDEEGRKSLLVLAGGPPSMKLVAEDRYHSLLVYSSSGVMADGGEKPPAVQLSFFRPGARNPPELEAAEIVIFEINEGSLRGVYRGVMPGIRKRPKHEEHTYIPLFTKDGIRHVFIGRLSVDRTTLTGRFYREENLKLSTPVGWDHVFEMNHPIGPEYVLKKGPSFWDTHDWEDFAEKPVKGAEESSTVPPKDPAPDGR